MDKCVYVIQYPEMSHVRVLTLTKINKRYRALQRKKEKREKEKRRKKERK